MVTTESQTLQLKVAQTLRDFWEYYTGVRPGRAIVVIDRYAIAALLAEVLTPAEKQLVQTEAGWLTIQKFEEGILAGARPHIQQLVTEAVGQEVILVGIHLDVVTESILGFFLRQEV